MDWARYVLRREKLILEIFTCFVYTFGVKAKAGIMMKANRVV
jgi:hypothetical protein